MNFHDLLEQTVLINPANQKVLSSHQEIESIARNLNKILNSTKTDQRLLKNRKALRESVFNIGITDFTHLHVHEENDREEVKRRILETIKTYESRLKNIQVQLDEQSIHSPIIKISIKGQVIQENFSHWIEFHGQLNLFTGNFPIKN